MTQYNQMDTKYLMKSQKKLSPTDKYPHMKVIFEKEFQF